MPKSLIILFILIVVLSAGMRAQSSVDFYYQKGNEYYLEENYAEAIRQYEAVISNGYESSELYYNLGNAYYRTGQLGKAILYYERALKQGPKDKNIRFNLRLANLRVKDRIDIPREFFIFRWNRNLVRLLSMNAWGWIMTLFFLMASVLLAVRLIINIGIFRRPARIVSTILFICAAMILCPLIQRYQMERSYSYGIILQSSTKSLAAPQEGSTELFIVHEGTKVQVLDRDGDWSKVELIDGKQGWILSSELEII